MICDLPEACESKTMKIKIQILVALVVSFFILLRSSFGQGALTPPGAPAPTFKTLQQVEPRTPISSAPLTISSPGSYYLTTNLTVATSNAITIVANNVTLDLSGFVITSTSLTPAGAAIVIMGSTNVTIFNGSISSGVTETGGIYSGRGFDSGIIWGVDANNTNTFGQPVNVRVSDVSVSGCMTYGILIGGLSTIVDSCSVHTVGGYGIYANTIKNSIAMDCGLYGIYGNQVLDCQGESIGGSWGIGALTCAQNCYGISSTGTGIHAQQSAHNCYGYSSGSDYGLYCEVAENCYGYSASGTGLRATSTAINCHAFGGTTGLAADTSAENCYGRCNTNGIGLVAGNAINCHGYCVAGNSGVGLSAGQASNCFGQNDGNGIGLSASVAIGCHGRCYGNNYGISATILNSCIYYRQTGTPGFLGTKYNMP
jgi:hypothetical protein